ncbi:MAG: DUF4114 domain-containing protein, partial [Dehalococcoidia bacterium]|nr:DUF4114 domain-containing protein [Dehalococcoidia bacterium]
MRKVWIFSLVVVTALIVSLALVSAPKPGLVKADTLQGWFDANGYTIDITTDELGKETFDSGVYLVAILNGEHGYMNPTGWYTAGNASDTHLIFPPPIADGDKAHANSTEEFGFYIDSDANGGTFFYTETALNADGYDHAWVFNNTKGCGYIVAFEDLWNGGDEDYTDRVIEVVPTFDLTVTSNGCCPITVGLPTGNETVPADDYQTFYEIPCGTNVTLAANDTAECCDFDDWSGDVNDTGSASTFIIMDDDKSVTANCTQLGPYTLDITANGCCTEVKVDSTKYDLPYSGNFTCGANVALEAVDGDCCDFVNWSGDASGTSTTTSVHMDGNKTVTIHCTELGPYDLTVISDGCCDIEVGAKPPTTVPAGGNQTFENIPCGTTVNLEAITLGSCIFNSWTGNVANPSSGSTSITMYDNETVTAHCSEPTPTPTPTVTPPPIGGGGGGGWGGWSDMCPETFTVN